MCWAVGNHLSMQRKDVVFQISLIYALAKCRLLEKPNKILCQSQMLFNLNYCRLNYCTWYYV